MEASSPKIYDVFLSFRGEVRNNFGSHLYTALVKAGIQTFMDDNELEKGEEIAPKLLEAIAKSRISIPIFSQNYASSEWCLYELVQMMESRKTGEIVIPIFFNVNPRDVRKQINGFGKVFHQLAKNFKKETKKSWKNALREAGKLAGWATQDQNQNESTLIQRVVSWVSDKLNNASVNGDKNLVGIESCLNRLERLLNVESEETQIVGIWGMGGIGKSAVANALFQKIKRGFDCYAFLEDVRHVSKEPTGLVRLQTQLLDYLLQCKLPISHVDGGKGLIKTRLHGRKVLIILDDVDKPEQLEALAGGVDWFGRGSVIIITTRDIHLLNVHKVHEIYEVKELYFYPSLQLFIKHAFGGDWPPDDFMELAQEVVLTAGGLPLVLKVLGSHLYDKADLQIWKSSLKRWKKNCPKDVKANLEISYNELDRDDKEIFLDVACFFIGIDIEYAIDIGEGCGFSAWLGMMNLIQKSLVKIDFYNKLRMHDQLRDMGRRIVIEKNPDEPGKRSRLWSLKEVVEVLKKRKGTKNVEGIILKSGEETSLEENHFDTEDFAPMSKLRLLQIDNVHLSGDFGKLPANLRWLSWKGCPLESIPTNFCLEKLSVLDLSYSSIKKIWYNLDQCKQFQDLKVLDLGKCRNLTKTPKFSRFPNLQILNLEGCIELKKLGSNICKLESLKILNLSGCLNLKKVPELWGSRDNLKVLKLNDCKLLGRLPVSIGCMTKLTSLFLDGTIIIELPEAVGSLEMIEVLSVRNCKNLVTLPHSMGKMRKLRRFELDRTGISKLPKDFGKLSSLEVLSMSGCREFIRFPKKFGKLIGLKYLNVGGNSKLLGIPYSFSVLTSLTSLDASGCNISEIPSDFGKLSSLEKLYLSYNDFCSLPVSISALSRLEYLALDNCRNLRFLPELPSSLRILTVENCVSLETLSNLSNLKGAYQLNISNCKKLTEVRGIEEMKSLQELGTSGCNPALVDSVKKSFGQGSLKRLPLSLMFPDCFTFQNLKLRDAVIWDEKRCEIRLECVDVPPTRQGKPEQHRKITGVDLGFVYTDQSEIINLYVEVNRNGERVCSSQRDALFFIPRNHQDESCLCHLRNCFHEFGWLKEGDEITFTIETKLETEVKKSGMSVVYEAEKKSICCKRIWDFFACTHDDDAVDVSRKKRRVQQVNYNADAVASSRKRRRVQLLDRGDGYSPFSFL